MKKIPTAYRRDPADMKRILPQIAIGCEWVFAGEGVATAKVDGTCMMLDDDGRWWARREVKKDAVRPVDFIEVQHDPATSKTVGWEPVEQSPFAKFHHEALSAADRDGHTFTARTYELCGPKINKNPVHLPEHRLLSHGDILLPDSPRSFEALRDYLTATVFEFEGIVWWHPDGRCAKLKVRDFPE